MYNEEVSLFFFFQAEDGIRDLTVTGVQTCALPISWGYPVTPIVFILFALWLLYNTAREQPGDVAMRDRKSTRLNSSHSQISYAVFCLKKKKKTKVGTYGICKHIPTSPIHRALAERR